MADDPYPGPDEPDGTRTKPRHSLLLTTFVLIAVLLLIGLVASILGGPRKGVVDGSGPVADWAPM